MRHASVMRATEETQIEVKLTIEGRGRAKVESGVAFLDHMLEQIAVHGLFDLELAARGDLEIDDHHTVEDCALLLGRAFDEALEERAGLVRVGSAWVPMDEALAFVAVDFSGRPYCVVDLDWAEERVADLPASLLTHFLESFAVTARTNLHARLAYGRNGHHQAEALFKALARALDMATRIDDRREESVPSSKGTVS